MGDDLHRRYAEALANAECEKRPRCTNCMVDAVLAVRDEELGRERIAADVLGTLLREEGEELSRALARACGAEAELQTSQARAEKAEAKLARFRTFLDTDFRQWCSPYGVAGQYAKDLLEILDRDPA